MTVSASFSVSADLASLAQATEAFAGNFPWMQEAVRVVKKALHVCRSASEISLAFNGGKDCTVLLFLVLPLWREKFPNAKLPLLYIHDEGGFEEESHFVQTVVNSYLIDSVSLVEIKNLSMKNALSHLTQTSPELRMIFMGTRRSDPHGNALSLFDPTDSGWPAFVRVNPLLNWSYHDVWKFLRVLKIPFCSLYLHGYTSVGAITNTVPNPALLRDDGSYAPAWELQDERDERKGRF